uniref:Reverse transcriptase Ty1/copia-type domain-containing protein n=1 Tax=Solanum lycopersicum TaxID=4081 RepID=A0A3Q7IDJ4_SOLLC
MLIIGSTLALIEDTKQVLQKAFKMKDLGELKDFLGIEFSLSEDDILTHQRKYALELIVEVGMTTTKTAGIPIDVNVKLTSRSHMDAALRIVRYLKKEPGQGLLLTSSSDELVYVFCDADWASCSLTRSSAEAEYRSMPSKVSELVWLLGLLKEVGVGVKLPVQRSTGLCLLLYTFHDYGGLISKEREEERRKRGKINVKN